MKLDQLLEHETQEALNNISVSWDDYLIEGADDIKLSYTYKLPKTIPSWDLQAGATCPGSKCPTTGEIKPSCMSCYAKKGHFTFPPAKNLREFNRKDWKRKDWIDDMVDLLGDVGKFRWFSSGDVYHPALAEKIYKVMKRTSHVTHWFPTMSHSIPKLATWVDKMDKLKNVTVRRSAGKIDGTFADTDGSTIVDKKTAEKWVKSGVPKGITLCPAGTTEGGEVPSKGKKAKGKCERCRACFDKKTKMIAYIKH